MVICYLNLIRYISSTLSGLSHMACLQLDSIMAKIDSQSAGTSHGAIYDLGAHYAASPRTGESDRSDRVELSVVNRHVD
jgi:hypothetical protein